MNVGSGSFSATLISYAGETLSHVKSVLFRLALTGEVLA